MSLQEAQVEANLHELKVRLFILNNLVKDL